MFMKSALIKGCARGRTVATIVAFLFCVSNLACNSSTTRTGVSSRQIEAGPGFLDKMMNQVTARECNVGKFTCPFGMGPAGEPCDCTDPSGMIRSGRTVK